MDKRTAYRKKASQDATSVGFFMVFMATAGSKPDRFTTNFLRMAFSHIDGRPRFAKHSINDGKQVEIAAIDPDF